MIHHVSIGTNGVARARSFYDAVMPILGLRPLDGSAVSADYGPGAFLFGIETPVDEEPASVGNGSHIAFAAGRRAMVDRFYEVALQHGGRDAGAPGLRPQSDGNYHGAFVPDPDGHKIEAVTYRAGEAGRPSYPPIRTAVTTASLSTPVPSPLRLQGRITTLTQPSCLSRKR